MKEALTRKFDQARPIDFTPEESEFLCESLRKAVGIALNKDVAEIADEALIFDDLGLDSIDVFDVLEQLSEEFGAQVALEEIPNDLIYGKEGITFQDFADALLEYFRTAPASQAN